MRNLPGYPTHWLLGNLHQLRPDAATLWTFTRFVQEGRHKVTKLWFGPWRVVVGIQHSSALRSVLQQSKDPETYKLLLPWLGEGLLIAGGKKWFRNRRLLTPAFHFKVLQPYIPVYNLCLEELLVKWTAFAENGHPVKLFDTISLMSLDIVLRCAFSYESDCQRLSMRHPYIKSVYELIEMIAVRGRNPIYRASDLIWNLMPSGRRMRGACKVVHDHAERVIRERRKVLQLEEGGEAGSGNGGRRRDFLDVLLLARDEEGEGLTDLEIRNEVDTFMFEGHDTTTSGMCWTLYLLAKHPEHQERVREEVREVLAGREWLEYEDLKELKYTHWCIKEGLRLYPPVNVIFRRADTDLVINGHSIPVDTPLAINIFGIHRHPDSWEQPDEFDPLRFQPSKCEDRDPYDYIPFSAGHRNCIGQNFATNEEKVVVASIIHRFRLSLVKDHEVEIFPIVVLRTKNDILLKLEPL